MAILTDPPEWRVPGPKPPQNITHELGWEVGSHPPAPWFNWFFHRVFESLLELEAATLARVINEAGVPGIMAGRESERPAASPETAGRIFIAIDTKRMYRDRGNGWDLLNTPEAIGAETPDGAQAKAEAAANAALASAKSYADDVVAAHANRTDNPHGVTKAQVGLGNVENYGVATQAEAEAGTATNKYMTPLRVAQAIAALGASRTWVETTFYPRSFWASSASASGYVKFPNGIIIQWGLSPPVGHGDNTSVTFPIAFPTDCLRVIAVKQNSTTSDDDNFAVVRGFSKTGADFRMEGASGLHSGTRYVAYLAIGY